VPPVHRTDLDSEERFVKYMITHPPSDANFGHAKTAAGALVLAVCARAPMRGRARAHACFVFVFVTLLWISLCDAVFFACACVCLCVDRAPALVEGWARARPLTCCLAWAGAVGAVMAEVTAADEARKKEKKEKKE
jgi:hypothetical protein